MLPPKYQNQYRSQKSHISLALMDIGSKFFFHLFPFVYWSFISRISWICSIHFLLVFLSFVSFRIPSSASQLLFSLLPLSVPLSLPLSLVSLSILMTHVCPNTPAPRPFLIPPVWPISIQSPSPY